MQVQSQSYLPEKNGTKSRWPRSYVGRDTWMCMGWHREIASRFTAWVTGATERMEVATQKKAAIRLSLMAAIKEDEENLTCGW